MSNMFIYGFRFTMLCLDDGPIPSQPDFPTGQALVFVFFHLKKGIRLMIDIVLAMGAHWWVPVPLCSPAATPFLDAVGLSLEILIVIGYLFMTATSSFLVAASLALLATSYSSTVSLLLVAARLSKYPLSDFILTASPQSSVVTLMFW